MRLIDADKVDFSDVFVGASDFAREAREAAQSLIDSQPDMSIWIPVEERIPDEDGTYLVTVVDEDTICPLYTYDTADWEDGLGWDTGNVVAWMQGKLLEPYKPTD